MPSSKIKKRLARNLQFAKARTKTLVRQGVKFNPGGVSQHTRQAAADQARTLRDSAQAASILASRGKRRK